MKSISIIALLIAPFAVSAIRVSWNSVYDQGTESLSNVACSNGPNGLLSKGYNEFSDLPTFPNITGSSVATWDSPYCGTCWNLTYMSETITVTVVDSAVDGFNLGERAMNYLTNNQAAFFGAVDATAVQVDASHCGLPA